MDAAFRQILRKFPARIDLNSHRHSGNAFLAGAA
jgi:hypothetical protein